MKKFQVIKHQAATSKSPLKGTMNEDEIKLNMQLLKEIRNRKISVVEGGDNNLQSV